MARQVILLDLLLALFVGTIAAASSACDDEADSCNAVPRQGRALLQVVSREAPSQQTKTPALERYVENELLPQAEATRQALQTEMDTLYVGVDNCSRIMHEHSVDVLAEKANITLAENKHHVCDVAQQKKIDDKEKTCGEVKSLMVNMKVPPSLESVKSNGTFDTGAMTKVLFQQYNFYTEYAPKLGEVQEGCALATEVLEKHGKTCESEMEVLGAAICALKHKLSDECDEYEKCYSWRLAYIKPEVEKVKKLEEHNKNEFKYRSCFGVENCDQAAVDASTLSVSYPPMPEKGTCIQGTHTKFSYPALDCGAVVAATTRAPELATTTAVVETTPAPAEITAAPADTTTNMPAAAAPADTTAAPLSPAAPAEAPGVASAPAAIPEVTPSAAPAATPEAPAAAPAAAPLAAPAEAPLAAPLGAPTAA